MTDKQQPKPLRIAALLEKTGAQGSLRDEAASELRRLHAENNALRTGYEAARLDIESLKCRRREPGHPDHQTHMEPPVFVGGKCPMRIET